MKKLFIIVMSNNTPEIMNKQQKYSELIQRKLHKKG